MRFLAVLDTMWGGRAGNAPNFFAINQHNFSGKRLYRLTGEEPGCLWCTNVCPELVSGPEQHGTPSVERLTTNLDRWQTSKVTDSEKRVYLVCGRVAQGVFDQITWPVGRTIYLPHPAARNWTNKALDRAAKFIQDGKHHMLLRIENGELMVNVLRGG